MPITIETTGGVTIVGEKTTPTIQVSFTDETGAAVIPSAINWSLSDSDGNIINSRDEIAVGSPASTINVTLTETDTTLQAGESAIGVHRRYFSVEATYDSDLGSNLVAREEGVFAIENFTSE